METVNSLKVGDYVIDTEDDNPDLGVVILKPEMSIAEWVVYEDDDGEHTVADDNPEYNPDEDVVLMSFVETGLDERWEDWEDADPHDLYEGVKENSVKFYCFPESRLRKVDRDEWNADPLDKIEEELERKGWKDYTREGNEIVIEKFGDEYRINEEGEVEGEGTIRDKLVRLMESVDI